MPLHIVRGDVSCVKTDTAVIAWDSLFARTGDVRLKRAVSRVRAFDIAVAWPQRGVGVPDEETAVERCCRNALELAARSRFTSVAFPLTSGSKGEYPLTEALPVLVRAIRRFLEENETDVFLVVDDRGPELADGETLREVRGFAEQCRVEVRSEADDCPPMMCCTVSDEDDGGQKRIAALLKETEATAARLAAAKEAYEKRLRSLGRQNAGMLEYRARTSSGKTRYPAPDAGPLPATAPSPRKAEDAKNAKDAALPPELLGRLRRLDEGFREMLLRLIAEQGMSDAECYHRANLDRRLFNKILNVPDYRPKKPTVAALCVALRLDWRRSCELLSRAGYSMNRASQFDVIVEYFITRGEYDLDRINFVLFDFDQPLLGSSDRTV